MDRREYYKIALDKAGAGDTVAATCVEGIYQGSRALYQKGLLQAALPESSTGFWQQVSLPEDDGFRGLIDGPDSAEVFLEPLVSEPRLIIVGAGHVAQALAKQASVCGFRVFVVDERPQLLTGERFPNCVLMGDFSALSSFSGRDCYFAIMAADHETSERSLAAVMSGDYAYVGMIGAARRRPGVLSRLREAGIPEEKLKALALPIGLDIGAETPAEVAVSILAQLIAVRRRQNGGAESDIPLYRTLSEKDESLVLATVIKTDGPAPRDRGAKLLRLADGRLVGSVGGGALEEDVLTVAAMTVEDGVPRRVFSQSEAGGRVQVFVERV